MEISENISLKDFNTFGIGYSAKKLIRFFSEIEIQEYLKENKIIDENILILGGGSNILFTQNFNGIIFQSGIRGIKEISKTENDIIIEVGSGEIWDDLVNYCVNKNYGGIENLSMIPGTVGAAPIQNIGAYGTEFEEVFVSLEGIDLHKNDKIKFVKSECKFGYRESIFKREFKNKFIITKVVIKLKLSPKINPTYKAIQDEITKGNYPNLDVKLISEIVRKIRASKLPNPNEIGNAGSFFKNPTIKKNHFEKLILGNSDLVFYKIDENNYKIPAGWLIENCGFKGKRINDAGVHAKQALVLVNYGNASGSEILNLADEIKKVVFNKFQIDLEFEVNII
ncbi:MAG: UDP-N-acetylmuramate dehydrogenase [Ignavibacteriae bacterium]|nr:UDP-N-acetylmuramate dehydrogenase [Ignavibacteriota bacterium]